MNKTIKPILAALAFSTISACTNYVKEADTAYLKGDWDTAISYYAEALKREDEPLAINILKARLTESKKNGSESHLQKAINAKSFGDIEAAYKHASTSYLYLPTDKALSLVTELKKPERDRLISLGENALSNKLWDDAISYLSAANKVDKSDKANQLIEQASAEKAAHYQAEFSRLTLQANSHLKNRDWKAASETYQNALKYGSDSETNRYAEFASLMLEGEQNARNASSSSYYANQAEQAFNKALSYGVDTKHVESRINSVALRSYRVTFHSAVITPNKPNSKQPWDGVSLANNSASNLMANLGSLYIGGGAISPELTKSLVNIASTGFSAPDCYIIAHVNGKSYGGLNTINQDDYQPVWEMSLNFNNVNRFDNTVISVQVLDADQSDHDNVGSYQVRLSDLIAHEGVQEKVFFNDKGELQANGLLAIRISATQL